MPNNEPKLPQIRAGVLERVRAGQSPQDACEAEGLTPRSYRRWRALARDGVDEMAEFFEAMGRAKADGEYEDIVSTRKAAQPKRMTAKCGQCAAPVEIDLSTLEAWHRQQVDAARIALERLARRNPRAWAPSSRVSINAEADALLDLAEEVLEPLQFQKLLAAYVESTGGVVPVVEPPAEGDGTPSTH